MIRISTFQTIQKQFNKEQYKFLKQELTLKNMKNFCLYHTITNQKSSQRNPQNMRQRSSKKNGKNLIQISKQNSSMKNHSQFNDYTIYPEKPKPGSKNFQLDFKKVSDIQSAVSKKTKTLKSSRFQHTFDHEYFCKEQKSFRTTKSLKNSKQNLNQSHSQMKLKNSQREIYDSKINLLESQIYALNKNIETCQAQSRKNHFQFVLLRDIVDKLKMQNLELSSKMSVFDQFVKKNMKDHLQKQYIRNNIQQMSIKNLQKQRKQEFLINEPRNLSENQIQGKISIQNQAESLNDGLNGSNYKKEKQTKLFKVIQQNSFKQKIVKPKLLHQQKIEQKSFKYIQTKKVKQVTAQKKQINLNPNSTIKRNKPKKILHFQNIFKQKTDVKDTQQDEISKKIEKIRDIQNYGDLNPQSSLNVSEQNLLESQEMIRNPGSKIGRKKELIQSPSQNELSYRFKPEDCLKGNKIHRFDQYQPQNLKNVQNQYKQLKSVFESLKSKEESMNPKDSKINEIKAQKQRVLKIMKTLQGTYHLHS